MRYILIVIVVFASLAISSLDVKAADNYMTGRDLQKFCTSKFNTDYGYCVGFVTGVADIALVSPIGGIKPCHKTSIKSQQLVDIVMNYIKNNPEIKRKPARFVILSALNNAFPCMKLQ